VPEYTTDHILAEQGGGWQVTGEVTDDQGEIHPSWNQNEGGFTSDNTESNIQSSNDDNGEDELDHVNPSHATTDEDEGEQHDADTNTQVPDDGNVQGNIESGEDDTDSNEG
jgi:hypothetical protein